MYQLGSELSVPEKFYRHVGVYVGDNRVFHNSPECGEVLTSVSEFAKGREINVTKQGVNDTSGFFSRLTKSMCNPQDYNIVKHNCEHTASRIRTGVACSPQLVGWTAAIIGLVVSIAVLRSK